MDAVDRAVDNTGKSLSFLGPHSIHWVRWRTFFPQVKTSEFLPHEKDCPCPALSMKTSSEFPRSLYCVPAPVKVWYSQGAQ